MYLLLDPQERMVQLGLSRFGHEAVRRGILMPDPPTPQNRTGTQERLIEIHSISFDSHCPDFRTAWPLPPLITRALCVLCNSLVLIPLHVRKWKWFAAGCLLLWCLTPFTGRTQAAVRPLALRLNDQAFLRLITRTPQAQKSGRERQFQSQGELPLLGTHGALAVLPLRDATVAPIPETFAIFVPFHEAWVLSESAKWRRVKPHFVCGGKAIFQVKNSDAAFAAVLDVQERPNYLIRPWEDWTTRQVQKIAGCQENDDG